MTNATASIGDMKEFGDELARTVSELLANETPCPGWHTKQAAWRHQTAKQNALLFILLKLAGSVSATNAMLSLAEHGFWFECAMLSRTIHDANLAIAFILPASEPDWPSAKQKNALDEFFKETWGDPEHPFEDSSQRTHILIKDLKEGLAKFQNANTEVNPYDSGQTALQTMRFLSDYTHMAYPRLMELLEVGHGYRLSGEQSKSSAFGVGGVAGTLNYCASTAHAVSLFMMKVAQGAAEHAKGHGNPKAERLATKSAIITGVHDRLASLSNRVESATTPAGTSVRKVLRDFKTREKGTNKALVATSESAAGAASAHQG